MVRGEIFYLGYRKTNTAFLRTIKQNLWVNLSPRFLLPEGTSMGNCRFVVDRCVASFATKTTDEQASPARQAGRTYAYLCVLMRTFLGKAH